MSALLLLAAQAMTADAATDLFMRTCVAGFGDAALFGAAAARAHFVEAPSSGRETRFRRGEAWIDYRAGEQCRIVVDVAGEAGADRAIAAVSAALDLGAPRGIAMRQLGWSRWRWPIAEAAAPRHYLAATTIRGREGATMLDLSIHAGPSQ